MGRQLDLERLALGRSAFQDVQIDEDGPSQGLHPGVETAGSDESNGQVYKQQYDSKGRPINPSTEERNESMRDAMNACLALVGVVERKDISDQEYQEKQKARELLLIAENQRGQDLDIVPSLLSLVLTWWPDTITARIQAGLYNGSNSFADIVTQGLTNVHARGYGDLVDTFFAGLPLSILYTILRSTFRAFMRERIGRLQVYLDAKSQRRRSQRATRMLTVTFRIVELSIDAILLPLQYYAITQKLGLAPSRPLLPATSLLLPWHSSSLHSVMWQSSVGNRILRHLCSPAILLLLRNFLRTDKAALS